MASINWHAAPQGQQVMANRIANPSNRQSNRQSIVSLIHRIANPSIKVDASELYYPN
jgi:hypothetical protein